MGVRERLQEARKVRIFCHEHYGYNCKRVEEANKSTTLEEILRKRGCNPWKYAQNISKILFTKNELKNQMLSPQKKTSREVMDCERSNLVKETINTRFPGQWLIARSAINQLGRNLRNIEKKRYLKVPDKNTKNDRSHCRKPRKQVSHDKSAASNSFEPVAGHLHSSIKSGFIKLSDTRLIAIRNGGSHADTIILFGNNIVILFRLRRFQGNLTTYLASLKALSHYRRAILPNTSGPILPSFLFYPTCLSRSTLTSF